MIPILILSNDLLFKKQLLYELQQEPRFQLTSDINSLQAAFTFAYNWHKSVVLLIDLTTVDINPQQLHQVVLRINPLVFLFHRDPEPHEKIMGVKEKIYKPLVLDKQTVETLCKNLSTKIKLSFMATFEKNQEKKRTPLQIKNETIVKQVILIASSTGGTDALVEIFSELPGDLPPICMVQHMPKGFTYQFAKRLNSLSNVNVQEAVTGQILKNGEAYLAPGNFHMSLVKSRPENSSSHLGENPVQIHCFYDKKVHGVRPAADILFLSAGRIFKHQTISVILTGMGKDGAKAMKYLQHIGGATIAQDEETSTVFGMPKAAIDMGAVHFVMPLKSIANKIIQLSKYPFVEPTKP